MYPLNGTITGINTKYIREEAKKNPGIFENDMYDAIHDVCKLLFPRSIEASAKQYKLFIKDRINLTLHFSGNEPKVYIDSFVFNTRPKNPTPAQHETYNELRKSNYTFRFFALEEVVNYLLIKQQENEYIKQNEG